MPAVADIDQAQAQFFDLVERVEAGEEIVICRHGSPVAKLIPFQSAAVVRQPGLLRGRIWMAPDFDETPARLFADDRSPR